MADAADRARRADVRRDGHEEVLQVRELFLVDLLAGRQGPAAPVGRGELAHEHAADAPRRAAGRQEAPVVAVVLAVRRELAPDLREDCLRGAFHKVEGEQPVYWTGPSLGFDLGGNAAKTFVLVYNLYDTQNLYKRFPAGEGAAYLVGGFNASYMRWKDVVLIPIRLGVGYRLGINAGYMKFSEKRNWLPF